MEIVIKKFKDLNKDELYDLLKLRNRIFIVEQACPYQDIDGKDREADHILLRDGERLIGYTRLLWIGHDLSLGRILLVEDQRGKGLGKRLVMFSIDHSIETLKAEKLYIEAQTYLVEFYEELGFYRLSDNYKLDGIDHCRMVLEKKHREKAID